VGQSGSKRGSEWVKRGSEWVEAWVRVASTAEREKTTSRVYDSLSFDAIVTPFLTSA